MADMQTMPVEELVKEIRIKTHDMDVLQALVFNVLCNRLEEQAELLGNVELRVQEALRREADMRRLLNVSERNLMKCKRTIRDMEIAAKRLDKQSGPGWRR